MLFRSHTHARARAHTHTHTYTHTHTQEIRLLRGAPARLLSSGSGWAGLDPDALPGDATDLLGRPGLARPSWRDALRRTVLQW